jgi:predicted Fe-Mo cluster-binding NifX family protein
MKIALPVLNGRVAPRFGMANTLLVLNLINGVFTNRKELELRDMSPMEKVRFLKQQEINVLICMGIEMGLYNYLSVFGVRVFSGILGDVEEVLQHYLTGHLSPGPVPGPCIRSRMRKGHIRRYGRRGFT